VRRRGCWASPVYGRSVRSSGRTCTEKGRDSREDDLQAGRGRLGLGRADEPHGGGLWVPWDRTTGVIGPQGSGKTLDLLALALLQAPGAALVTLTKVDDLLLSFVVRSGDGRPCVVLDPFGLAAGLPELLWDPVAGCWIRWWRSGGPRRSPPAPSRVRSPAGMATTPPVSMPLKRRR
jgi:hypothetical protein